MKIEEQYPLGTRITGTFHTIPFQARVIGYQPALSDQPACLDIEVIDPHPDLPIHRLAHHRSALDYHIYETMLCIDPLESQVTIIEEETR